ncbi:MAG: N-6 DNA methylase [Terriglobales bacterium]
MHPDTIESDQAPDLGLLHQVEALGAEHSALAAKNKKKNLGQFFTPPSIARFMASMISCEAPVVSVLDPGAGTGMLLAACVQALCSRAKKPKEIRVAAYEMDEALMPRLAQTVLLCRQECDRADVRFWAELRLTDFIERSVENIHEGLFSAVPASRYQVAILNPPYRKIHSSSRSRALLKRVSMETSNLYTAFLALVVMQLSSDGEMIAITPRSFCNGTYFTPFRKFLLKNAVLTHLHVFESRGHAFKDEEVLQENVVFRASKQRKVSGDVRISSSLGPADIPRSFRVVPADRIVHRDDAAHFIHIPQREDDEHVASRMKELRASLRDLGVEVSTGRVVDFRARAFLRRNSEPGTAPLIYPVHFQAGGVSWPKNTRKPNAIVVAARTQGLLVPNHTYVLVKRFSAKEEKRRLVAVIHSPNQVPGSQVGFENHLNYFHANEGGLPPLLAAGLAAFLNSSMVDRYFRQFNGHTQVNASDLRSLPYPTKTQLERMGKRALGATGQHAIDRVVDEELA